MAERVDYRDVTHAAISNDWDGFLTWCAHNPVTRQTVTRSIEELEQAPHTARADQGLRNLYSLRDLVASKAKGEVGRIKEVVSHRHSVNPEKSRIYVSANVKPGTPAVHVMVEPGVWVVATDVGRLLEIMRTWGSDERTGV